MSWLNQRYHDVSQTMQIVVRTVYFPFSFHFHKASHIGQLAIYHRRQWCIVTYFEPYLSNHHNHMARHTLTFLDLVLDALLSNNLQARSFPQSSMHCTSFWDISRKHIRLKSPRPRAAMQRCPISQSLAVGKEEVETLRFGLQKCITWMSALGSCIPCPCA